LKAKLKSVTIRYGMFVVIVIALTGVAKKKITENLADVCKFILA